MSELKVDKVSPRSGNYVALNTVESKNIVINGDMSIAQRNTSVASITGNGYYTLDRYQMEMSSLGTWTMSQSTDVPTGQGFAKSLKLDCTTADAAPAAGAYMTVSQRFEGQNLQYLKKGTANALPLTLSFWVKSTKTGTFIIELIDTNNTRSISKSYTVSVSNTWEFKTITFAGDTTGTFTNNNAASLVLAFWLGAGTNFTSGTLQTSWGSRTTANQAVGQVNIADSTSNDFLITGVQLEAGTTASDFCFLPFDVNLQRCQRYFQTSFNTGQIPVNNAAHANYMFVRPFSGSSFAGIQVGYRTRMRTTPSVALYTSAQSSGAVGNISYFDGSSWLNTPISIHSTSSENQFILNGSLVASAVLVQFNYAASAEL